MDLTLHARSGVEGVTARESRKDIATKKHKNHKNKFVFVLFVAMLLFGLPYEMESNSTSKISVALGGIAPG